MPREILTDWATEAGGGRRSVMYFDEAISVASQRLALGNFWAAIDDTLDSATLWTIETTGRDVNSATGTLEGVWADGTARQGAGVLAGEAVPDASQGLMRWSTGTIIDGRFVQGRTFIPGVSTSRVSQANLNAATQSAWNAAAVTLIAANVGLSVWHRPVGGAGGFSAVVDGGTAWSEFAVLRRRRS